jgi:thermitase
MDSDHQVLGNNDVAEQLSKDLSLRTKRQKIMREKSPEKQIVVQSVNPVRWAGPAVQNLPNDPLWDFTNLKIPKLWTYYGLRGEGVNAYIIDSGVSLNHTAFLGNIPYAQSFLPGVESPIDGTGHGTWVAGKIGGAGVGLAPKCNLHCLRVLDDSGTGLADFSTQALNWVLNQEDPHIVNLSLGGQERFIDQGKVIWQLYQRGVIVIAASGNLGTDQPFYPAAFDGLISVGAIDANQSKAGFSDYGGYLDLVAPGVACYSTYLNNGYRQMDGTSMAAPTITGLLTLGISLVLKNSPAIARTSLRDLIWQAIMNSIIDLGEKGRDEYFGYGEIDSEKFMAFLHEKTMASV